MNDYFARVYAPLAEGDVPLRDNDGLPVTPSDSEDVKSTHRFVWYLIALVAICLGFGLIRAVPEVGPPMSWIALVIWVGEIIIIELYARR